MVSSKVEQSEFRLTDDLPAADRGFAIAVPPAWQPDVWPVPSAVADSAGGDMDEQALEGLALRKLMFHFEFAAYIPGETGDEIRAGLYEAYPRLRDAETSAANPLPRYPVSARIDPSGECSWGFTTPPSGQLPGVTPGSGFTTNGGGFMPDLDHILRNLVRADLYDRIAARGGGQWL